MRDLHQLASFASAARHGSFAAAARELGVTPSTVAKSISRLEADLGVSLFTRSTRSVRLTEEGTWLFKRCSTIFDEIETIESALRSMRKSPVGKLRIDAPIVYGRQFIVPVLAEMQFRYPALEIDLHLSDEIIDIVSEGFDAAVRIGTLKDSSLIAIEIDRQQLITCASPAYLARHSTPATIDDLAAHSCLAFALPSTGRPRPWSFIHDNQAVELEIAGRTRANEGEALRDTALLGVGVAQLPDYMVRAQIASGQLVEILPNYRSPPMPISVIATRSRLALPRLRAFIERVKRR
ncbi:LysR family transcriptional regulator [Burkholderia sp. Ac-20384]|uniref:LysR family transcriptional regulator n=1 Tax=Burkholderia sp. Ac-20384 TaxID=2703902 RepID=UPI00197FF21A|nr:LysR family transcriptional regulator [Burkholderia sp. Ac-20384]MBN3825098.1 LysR family transcriptional regulator [Burkholderia sp. Ac-20384]